MSERGESRDKVAAGYKGRERKSGEHFGKETGDYKGRESFDLDFCGASPR